MKGYTVDAAELREPIFNYEGPHVAHIMDLTKLRVRMPRGDGGFLFLKIHQTPHYKYTQGDTQPYKDWLVEHRHLYDESLASFEHLMNDDSNYLDPPYNDEWIMHDDDLVIVDGVHRATRLYALGHTFVPVLRKIT